MYRSRYVPLALVVSACAGIAGCDRSPAAEPDYVPVESGRLLSVCQILPAMELSGMVGADGGVLQAPGVTMAIPAGALPGLTEFQLGVPSSPFAEVEIRANGQEHFQFLLPVVISIDYNRCGTPPGTLAAWHIDPETRALLENMGGVDDQVNHRVTFSTMHLSGYAIAN